jgi:hypothetical protein
MPEEELLPKDHPMLKAFEAYKASPEYANTFKHAEQPEHRDGSLWAAFVQGWTAHRSYLMFNLPTGPST